MKNRTLAAQRRLHHNPTVRRRALNLSNRGPAHGSTYSCAHDAASAYFLADRHHTTPSEILKTCSSYNLRGGCLLLPLLGLLDHVQVLAGLRLTRLSWHDWLSLEVETLCWGQFLRVHGTWLGGRWLRLLIQLLNAVTKKDGVIRFFLEVLHIELQRLLQCLGRLLFKILGKFSLLIL